MKFTQSKLEEILEDIDAQLRSENIPIPGRPLKAMLIFAKKFDISIPVTSPIPGTTHESYNYWPVTKFIHHWFDHRYGDRLKIYFGPGNCAFFLRGDPWFFQFPKFWGTYRLRASVENNSDELSEKENTDIYNIVESIPNLPIGLRKSITKDELQDMLDIFCLGFNTLNLLEHRNDLELIKSAKIDLNSAVSQLMSTKDEFGHSKWSTLQATEKVLKALIDNEGNTYKKIHDLTKLAGQLKSTSLASAIQCDLHEIQCSPRIRYGDEPTTIEDAMTAHHASLKVISKLIRSF